MGRWDYKQIVAKGLGHDYDEVKDVWILRCLLAEAKKIWLDDYDGQTLYLMIENEGGRRYAARITSLSPLKIQEAEVE